MAPAALKICRYINENNGFDHWSNYYSYLSSVNTLAVLKTAILLYANRLCISPEKNNISKKEISRSLPKFLICNNCIIFAAKI
jgi:hypothetical protein